MTLSKISQMLRSHGWNHQGPAHRAVEATGRRWLTG
ncbi:hypothetical protein [Streptomyces virginiae]